MNTYYLLHVHLLQVGGDVISYHTWLGGVGLGMRHQDATGRPVKWKDKWNALQAAHCAFAADLAGIMAMFAPDGERLPAGV